MKEIILSILGILLALFIFVVGLGLILSFTYVILYKVTNFLMDLFNV